MVGSRLSIHGPAGSIPALRTKQEIVDMAEF